MNSVVIPFFLMIVRWGCEDAEHGEFVSPVEYECKASARFRCNAVASSLANDRRIVRISASVRTVKGILVVTKSLSLYQDAITLCHPQALAIRCVL